MYTRGNKELAVREYEVKKRQKDKGITCYTHKNINLNI